LKLSTLPKDHLKLEGLSPKAAQPLPEAKTQGCAGPGLKNEQTQETFLFFWTKLSSV